MKKRPPLSEAERRAASERLKRRWAERREQMLGVLAKANAKAGARNKKRWKKDREKMLAVAKANAAKGTAKLTGAKFSARRRAEHSAALEGRVLGGAMAKGPENIRAKPFALCDPEGRVWRGVNLLHFVRSHRELFDPADVEFRGPECNAAKQLNRVARGNKPEWKGWGRADMSDETPKVKTLEEELLSRREIFLVRIRELRTELGKQLAELEALDMALKGFGHGANSGLADGIRKVLTDYGPQTPEKVHGRLVVEAPTLTRKDVSSAMSHLAKDGALKITREGGRGKPRIYDLA